MHFFLGALRVNYCETYIGNFSEIFISRFFKISDGVLLWRLSEVWFYGFCRRVSNVYGWVIFLGVMALWWNLVHAYNQQQMIRFQWNFMGTFGMKSRCAYFRHVMVGWFSWRTGPLIKALLKSCLHKFSATTDWISTKFHENLQFKSYDWHVTVELIFLELWPFDEILYFVMTFPGVTAL